MSFLKNKKIQIIIATLSIVGYGYFAFATIAPGQTLDPVNDGLCTDPLDPVCVVSTGWQQNVADGFVYNESDKIRIGFEPGDPGYDGFFGDAVLGVLGGVKLINNLSSVYPGNSYVLQSLSMTDDINSWGGFGSIQLSSYRMGLTPDDRDSAGLFIETNTSGELDVSLSTGNANWATGFEAINNSANGGSLIASSDLYVTDIENSYDVGLINLTDHGIFMRIFDQSTYDQQNLASDEWLEDSLDITPDGFLFTHQRKYALNPIPGSGTIDAGNESGTSSRYQMNADFLWQKGDGTDWNTIMKLDGATGNLGIGTDTPTATLDVIGDMRTSTVFSGGFVLTK